MAVEEKEDFKGRRKRGDVAEETKSSESSKRTFPVNITVDDLYLYRKKKHTFAWLKDNLKVEEGSFKHLKSEYTRRFKNFFDILRSSIKRNEKSLLDVEVLKPEDSTKLIDEKTIDNDRRLSKKIDAIENDDSNNEIINRFHPFGNATVDKSGRRRLLKRPNNLKIEGDHHHVTEHAENFIEFLLAKRAELCRTPTTLKLGTGTMETKTETTDKFRKFDNVERPTLIRKFTNLRLEGDLDAVTEKQEKFQRYEVNSKPNLIKKSTNLHLDGNSFSIPEYRDQYIQYNDIRRLAPILPTNNLKNAGLFDDTTPTSTNFGRTSPSIPFLRSSYSYHDLDEGAKRRRNVSSLSRTSSQSNLVKSADDRIKISSKSSIFEYEKGRNNSGFADRTKSDSTERDFFGHNIKGKRDFVRRRSGNLFEEAVGDNLVKRFECQPEYRKAIRDYSIREKIPPEQKRRILEIPDITINADSTGNEVTSQKSTKPPTSTTSNIPSTPKSLKPPTKKNTTHTSRRNSKINTETIKLSPDKMKRVYRRSSTPSPIAKEKISGGKQSVNHWKNSENNWNSTETDPAFFIVNDGVPSRRSVGRNLYKEQRWMPAWYSGEL
ncbi:uncharacterized protein LOC130901380 [Diorhabda carinulata]|uniref:uncharacterized protein LOC130901380 n=1 Tax=Diorhabda carinulata TaxID=1163345 RepID=UPI0025A1B697|nr:uncharacterized protein LOC130901380 [Diorhabda carinulata]